MSQTRVTLASILNRLPLEAVYWLEGLDALAFTATEIMLNSVGDVDDFVDEWQEHRAEEQAIALEFADEPPWPVNAVRKAVRLNS